MSDAAGDERGDAGGNEDGNGDGRERGDGRESGDGGSGSAVPSGRVRPRVKICGVTRPADRDAVVAAGADAVGVISEVSVDTPREVDAERAADLIAGVPPLVTAVLVTMPTTVQHATRLVDAVDPDAVQVHGTLSPGELGALGERVTQPVLAVVDAAADVDAYADAADALLVDSVGEAGGGGTGTTHDWERAREVVASVDVPVVLAGGLDPDNVADAVRTVDPFGVDVATGVERAGGVKDHDAVRAFVDAATGRYGGDPAEVDA